MVSALDSGSSVRLQGIQMGTAEFNAGGNRAMDLLPIQGRVEILLDASCYRNPDKLRSNEPLGSYADFTFPFS